MYHRYEKVVVLGRHGTSRNWADEELRRILGFWFHEFHSICRTSHPAFPVTCSLADMATSRRATQSLRDHFSRAVAPQYVCRTCRKHSQPVARQIRQISSSSPSPLRHKPKIVNSHPSFAAAYATKSPRDYVQPDTPLTEERRPIDVEDYVQARTWDGLEHVGHQGHWKDLPAQKDDQVQP